MSLAAAEKKDPPLSQQRRWRRLIADQPREIPTHPEWRKEMRRARKARGWTQDDLGRFLGTSQAKISQIEKGSVEASKDVAGITAALEIYPPYEMIRSTAEQRWLEVGRLLAQLDPDAFGQQLSFLGRMVDRSGKSD